MLYVTRVVALPIVCQSKKWRGAVAALLWFGLGCSRTGLDPGDLVDIGFDVGGSMSRAPIGGGGVPITGGGGASSGSAAISQSGSPSEPPTCTPSPETCNGVDDDCNGMVDDLAPIACPGGGSRFCLAGRLSACPSRCEVCVPGSVRVCQNSFCSFWGEEECAADGLGFSNCREALPPPECDATAHDSHDSAELEQCCLDNGYCCVDHHDLDHDGDRREMLGACGDVVCQ